VVTGLYAIVDVPHAHGLSPGDVAAAVLGERLAGGRHGAAIVQLRAKAASTEQRVAWARAMAEPCRRAGVPLVVNDDLEAALAAGADGVHLGQTDPGLNDLSRVRGQADAHGRAGFLVGVSTHDPGQLRAALRQAPDYVGYGPIAATTSKTDPDPVVGLSGLTEACRIASRPVVAIGGLDTALAEAAIGVGASAVAVIGALSRPDLAATRSAAIELAERLAAAAAPLALEEVARRIPVLAATLLHELAAWGDSLGVHVELGLPARFRPRIVNGRAEYRPSDVVDLVQMLGKLPSETWDDWRRRGGDESPSLVQLRSRA
jgi:thiamine-phosphate pyrophosphorylase